MNAPLSPLRYPGSKADLANYFESFLQRHLLVGCTLYEPYAGSASLSLAMLARDRVERAILVEKDFLLFCFWKAVLNEPDRLCGKIENAKVTLDTWFAFQPRLHASDTTKYSTVDLGFTALFLNRTNFSGVLAAKPIGGIKQGSKYSIGCRFNKSRLIHQIQLVAKYRHRMRVYHADALDFLHKNREKIETRLSCVYLDPPYFGQGKKLYRHYYRPSDHAALAQFVDQQRYPWLVSIDNQPEIRAMYKNQKIVPIFLNYVVKQSRKVKELLISNVGLLQPEYRDQCGKQIRVLTHRSVSVSKRKRSSV